MIGDGAISGSPKLKRSTGLPVRNVCSGTASGTVAMLQARASPKRCPDKAATPFFDLLTTMIEAHAAESGRALQNPRATGRIDTLCPDIADAKDTWRAEANAAPPAANRRWRVQQLN